jgi:hypothetical protein
MITEKGNVAKEILRQLGGNRFITMTGAKCGYDGNTLIVKFKGCSKINIMQVKLNSMDTYDIKFLNLRGTNLKMVKEYNGIYNDMLVDIFESTTGVYTSL